jgi:hypothetical protein
MPGGAWLLFQLDLGRVVGPGPGPFEAITASVAVARGPLASRATAIARGAALASKAAPRGPDPGRSTARPYGR